MKKKKIFFPISTVDSIMMDKSFPMALYGHMTLKSKRNTGEDTRYIYQNNFDFNLFCEEHKISKRTLQRQMAKLRKHESEIVNAINTEHGICYVINYKMDDGKNYVLIKEDDLRKLVNAYSDNTLKVYLVLLYVLKDKKTKKNVEKLITRDWLLNKIGLSTNSRQVITDCLQALEDANLIYVRKENFSDGVINKNGDVVNRIRTRNYISLIEN